MSSLSEAVRRLRPQRTALLVLVAGLLATTLATIETARLLEARDAGRFTLAADRIARIIDIRLTTYVAILHATAGLLAATPDVSASQFRAFVERLPLADRYPGVQGIGFTRRLRPGELREFVDRQRAQGLREFQVWPGFPRDEYHSIQYLEPMDRRNRAALGYDMFTDAVRRAAMVRARDTGEPAASGRVTLVQEIEGAKQAGFLIYLPVYRGGTVPQTVEARREQLVGFVYSPFRAGDLLAGTIHRDAILDLGFELFDGPPSTDRLFHRMGTFPQEPRFRTFRELDVVGRPWSVAIVSTPSLAESSSGILVPLAAAVGACITLLVAALLALEIRNRRRVETSEAALAETSTRFRQLADSIPQLVWMARPDGWVFWYNRRWYEYTGTTPEQMEGWGWQAVHDPQELPRVLDRWRAAIAAGEPFEMEFPIRGADGQYRWFLTRVTPMRNAAGRVLQWFGTNTDVQARRDYETVLREQAERLESLYTQVQLLLESERQLRAEAERVSRIKDEFLATLSHELRTPLNAIIGWSQLLIDGTASPEARGRALATIQRNARVQARLIEDLLDMSRIVSGKVRLDMQEVDLCDVVESALNIVRPTAQAKGVRIETALETGQARVLGDANRLQQVYWNLLTNAIKFTAPGGSVQATLRRVEDQLEFVVADTGIGIEPAFLPYVFDRFRQADGSSTRQHGGLGLGLAIVKNLVEMHGGRVRAASGGSGLGATFTVSLPEAHGTAAASGPGDTPLAVESEAAARAALAGRRVLVVDDDRDARELASAILQMQAAEVVTAASASEALQQLDGHAAPFDLLVSDLAMPGMDGYDLLREIRASAHAGVRGIRAIALTAYARAEDQARALAAGYDAYISKPFDPARLVLLCARALGEPSGSRSHD